MGRIRLLALALTTLLLAASDGWAATASPTVSHALKVWLDPDGHRLQVHDRLVIPAGLVTDALEFVLDEALAVRTAARGPGLRMVRRHVGAAESGLDRSDSVNDPPVHVNVYQVTGATPGRELTIDLDYQGVINHPIGQTGQQYGRGFSESPGLIETRGVYLAGSSHWVPEISNARLTYRLETDLPAGWKSVSEGVREASTAATDTEGRVHETWHADTPTEQVHLIAARFTEYRRDAGKVKAQVFLRTPDDALAARYLEATMRYLAMYQAALGDYPYGKFALVEYFWETGYGMPSFTLLGEQIIRFPFILTSSYPHELLHNWWGNGVFVDFADGNWCEGLTAYLADHLMAEQAGQGDAHRRDILARVTDYVTPANDFPLRRFRARYDGPTEAIGYGKAAMLWNMLRDRVGDALFLASLRRFYRDNAFKAAGFEDLRRAFEVTTGQDLQAFFRQWVDETGVPELALTSAERSGQHVSLTLAQTQTTARVAVDVPVALHTAQGVVIRRVGLSAQSASVTARFDLDAPVTRIDVDPQFQVYRRLSPFETPPSLSKAFGAAHAMIVLSTGAERTIYHGLVKAWTREGVQVVDDSDIKELPDDRPVWIIGRSNRFLPEVAEALRHQHAGLDASALQLADRRYPTDDKSIVAVVRNPANPASVLVHLSATSAAAADGLARKLPHYGKYSWLVFGGTAPDNEAKGEWPPGESPLTHVFESIAVAHPLPARKALLELPALFETTRLRAEVDWLAAPTREGPRLPR